jgi:hypothetical protein
MSESNKAAGDYNNRLALSQYEEVWITSLNPHFTLQNFTPGYGSWISEGKVWIKV